MNVVGNIHLFNIFLPLIKNGTIKKVVAITSGVSDMDLVADFQIDSGAAYAISKVGLNMVVAKFHAAFKNEGIIFMAICPGLVDTGHFDSSKSSNRQVKIRAEVLIIAFAISYSRRPD